MATASRVILLYQLCGIIMIEKIGIASGYSSKLDIVGPQTIHLGAGAVGVTSVAEITPKDGKLSSTGASKFYTPGGMKLDKNSNLMQPWTYSKKSIDGFAMGAVQMYPGGAATVMTSVTSNKKPNIHFVPVNPITMWLEPTHFFPQTVSSRIHRHPVYNIFKDYNSLFPYFGDTWSQPFYDPFIHNWH